jgi:hypothetical protein
LHSFLDTQSHGVCDTCTNQEKAQHWARELERRHAERKRISALSSRLDDRFDLDERQIATAFVAWFESENKGLSPDESLVDKISRPEDVLGWGKHKGKIISDVLAEDPSYVKWISEKADGPFSSLKKRARELMVGMCHSCFEPTGNKEEWKTLCMKCFRNR